MDNNTGGNNMLDNTSTSNNTQNDNSALPPITTTPNGIPESSQQQQAKSASISQPKYSSSSSSSTTNDSGEYLKLADMEEEIAEMEIMLSDKIAVKALSPEWKKRYLTRMTQVEDRKNEMDSHINHLVEKKKLKREDADVYLRAIHSTDDTDINIKRPIFGFVEASLQNHKEQEQVNYHKFKIIEESNKRYAKEREDAISELEGMKKKIKSNDFAGFGGSSNNNSNTLYQQQQQQQQQSQSRGYSETLRNVNLLDFMQKSSDPNVKREVINMHLTQQYDFDTANNLSTDEKGKLICDRLYAGITKYS